MALVEGTNCGWVTVAPSADPTGAQLDTIDNRYIGGRFTSPASAAKITEIGYYEGTAGGSSDFEVGIYSHDSGGDKPDALLASVGPEAKAVGPGWFSIAIDYEITGSTIYWLAIQVDNTTPVCRIDTGATDAGERRSRSGVGATTLVDPWGGGSIESTYILAIYAVYEEAAPKMWINIGDAWKEIG